MNQFLTTKFPEEPTALDLPDGMPGHIRELSQLLPITGYIFCLTSRFIVLALRLCDFGSNITLSPDNMMIRLLTFCFALLLGCVCTTHAYAQVFAGLTADFEDNTTQGFGVGGAAGGVTPVVFGIDGGFVLQNQSVGGAGPLSAQLIQNETTFTGDFISAGITGISATVAVDPTSEGPLFLRLGFTDNASGGGTGFSSADALVVQNDGEFVDLFFEINDTALVNVPGTGTASFEEVLSNVDRLRILSAESGPAYIVNSGDRLASTLLIDNIVAVGVPEPASVPVLLIAGLMVTLRRRK